MHLLWTAYGVGAYVFAEEVNGNAIGMQDQKQYTSGDSPLVEIHYIESISISGNLETDRRPVTGRTQKKIVNQQWTYSAKVSNAHLKITESGRSVILSRNKFITLVVAQNQWLGPSPSPVGIANHQQHILKRAKVISFDLKSGSIMEQNAPIVLSMDIQAEDYIQYPER